MKGAYSRSSLGLAFVAALLLFFPAVGLSDRKEIRPDVEPSPTPEEAGPPVDLETPPPTEWLPALRRCQRYRGGRRFCDGPRRVPVPHGPALEWAERLGLGENPTAVQLLTRGPLAEWVAAVPQYVSSDDDTLLWPVAEARIGRGLGRPIPNSRERSHNGVDMPAAFGTLVRSVDDGIVAYTDNGVRGMGNVAMVVHRNGTVGIYVHLRAIYLFAGQRVYRGQVLGEVGSTGLSQGAHLHFELRCQGRPIDPHARFVEFPLDEEGWPRFARERPRSHAERFTGFGAEPPEPIESCAAEERISAFRSER
ncbi:MAG: M23 family metallopeptidase [Myxococcota bacterium]